MQTAVLSSAAAHGPRLLTRLSGDEAVSGELLARLAALVGAGVKEEEIASLLERLTGANTTARQFLIVEGLARGLARGGRPLTKHLGGKSGVAGALRRFVDAAVAVAGDGRRPVPERVAAIRLLGHAPLTTAGPVLQEVLQPREPSEVQTAAVQALAMSTDPSVAGLLLAGWPGYGPAVRREVQEALFARSDRIAKLLDAVERGQVLPGQLDPLRRDQLLRSSNAALRERAEKLLAGQVSADRQKVLEEYRPALDLSGDVDRGRGIFRKNCTTCHRLENEGFEVGPDLLSALKNKAKETLLLDILDPSREVDPRYMNYVVTTKNGRVLTGLIAGETASSLLLRRGDKAEDTLLRSEIDEIQSTAKSLMPEGLEKQLSPQDVADVIAYLLSAVGRKELSK
jgi:putative heme-binding domain-containing protein